MSRRKKPTEDDKKKLADAEAARAAREKREAEFLAAWVRWAATGETAEIVDLATYREKRRQMQRH